jgi:predicted acylesterase/phospholipase RssA
MSEQPPLALALSGGGFRATLYHLGVLEYLARTGRLHRLAHVVGVSGGSLTAAHLLHRWSHYTGGPETFEQAKRELIGLARSDVRGRILRRLPYINASKLLPAKYEVSSTQYLSRLYDAALFKGRLLSDLPSVPRLWILTTNLTEAALTIFSQREVQNVFLDPEKLPDQVAVGLTPIAVAVAASSAVPMLFPPFALTNQHVGAPEATFRHLLSDGGVTDNLGLTTLKYILGASDAEVVASDAGRSFVPAQKMEFGLVRTAFRASDLMMFRIREMELLRARETPGLSLVSISDLAGAARAAPRSIQEQLEFLRTDLDAFTEPECKELIRHGFWCTWRTLDSRVDPDGTAVAGVPAGAEGEPIKLAQHLRAGSARRLWSSLLSRRDWMTAVNSMVVAVLIGAVAWTAPRAWQALLVTYHQLAFPVPTVRRGLTPVPLEVERLERPQNTGFDVDADDRVWDLRQLRRTGETVSGSAVMTRTVKLRRSDHAVTHYVFWFETSGRMFNAWPITTEFPLELRTQREAIFNGRTTVVPWELRIDVSSRPLNEPFVLSIQTESIDAFLKRPNWWTGMTTDRDVGSASMRIVFPKELPYRSPVFLKYQRDRANETTAFDGTLLTAPEENELIWRVEKPLVGWVYRVEWFW